VFATLGQGARHYGCSGFHIKRLFGLEAKTSPCFPCVYQGRKAGKLQRFAIVSYDEKPGIQVAMTGEEIEALTALSRSFSSCGGYATSSSIT
jgi:hypothetical protein